MVTAPTLRTGFAGAVGVELDLAAVPTSDAASLGLPPVNLLFAEDAGRFLVEVTADNYDAFLRAVADCPFGELGRVTDTARIVIKAGGRNLVDLPIAEAKAAWKRTFDW